MSEFTIYVAINAALDIEIEDYAIKNDLTPAQQERVRAVSAQLARVLAQALDSQRLATPERASDAAFKLVTALRESARKETP